MIVPISVSSSSSSPPPPLPTVTTITTIAITATATSTSISSYDDDYLNLAFSNYFNNRSRTLFWEDSIQDAAGSQNTGSANVYLISVCTESLQPWKLHTNLSIFSLSAERYLFSPTRLVSWGFPDGMVLAKSVYFRRLSYTLWSVLKELCNIFVWNVLQFVYRITRT